MAITLEQAKIELAKRELERRKENPNNSKSVNKSVSRINDFLPGKEKVNDLISKRSSPVDILREEVMQPWEPLKHPIKTALRPLVTGIKTIGAPFQALESGVASAGLSAQAGDGPIDIIKSAAKGVAGKENAQLGDLVRTTGFGGAGNELLSSIIGFSGMVGVSNLATKGKILEGANKIKNEIQVSREISKNKKAFYLKNKAEALQEGHGEIKKSIGYEIGKIHDNIGNNPINSSDMIIADEVVSNIPKVLLNKFNRLTKSNITSGNIKDTKGLIELKKLVGRSIPDRVWNGLDSPTPEQMALKDYYFELSDMIANYAGGSRSSLLDLNSKYKKLINAGEVIGSLTKDSLGLTNPTGLKNIRSTANQGKLEVMLNLSKEFMPKAGEIIKDIDKYNRNEMIQKAAGSLLKTLGIGAAGGAAYKAINGYQN